MANILVTGASGFLGSHIADALSDQNHNVTLFDIEKSKYLREDQDMVIGSVTDADLVKEVCKGIDYVYHLAALADLNDAKNKPLETVQINILGTVNILEACRINKIKRILFGSSVYVYSHHGGFYRCSKQACENYIEEYQKKFGLDYTILRYGSLYGTRTDNSNGVYRLLSQYMAGEEIVYKGNHDDKREYIHVADAAKLSVQSLSVEYVNKHLTLTGNDRLTIAELFKMFGEILGQQTDIKFDVNAAENSGHYSITPYNFTPKLGKKLISNEYVDMGQGIIQVIEYIHNKINEKD